MDLLDPNQKNLQVNSKTPSVLIIFLVLHSFVLELIFLFVQIREDVKSGVYVENLSEEPVSSIKDVTQLLIKVFVTLTLPLVLY